MKSLARDIALLAVGALICCSLILGGRFSMSSELRPTEGGGDVAVRVTRTFIGPVEVPGWAMVVLPVLAVGLFAVLAARIFSGRSGSAFAAHAVALGLSFAAAIYVCVYELSISGMGLLMVALVALVPLSIGTGIAWARTRPSASLAGALSVAASLLPLTALLNPWPLHAAFLISRPSLDRVVAAYEAGDEVELPRWVGVFYVHDIDSEGERVALITDPTSAGRSGLVHSGVGYGPGDAAGPMVNLNWDLPIHERWRYQNED